jgi:hypothetical protein
MPRPLTLVFSLLWLACIACSLLAAGFNPPQSFPSHENAHAYLGFDRNEYPGDPALPILRKTFSFASYWLSPPPGEKHNTWIGKRASLRAQGFGFVVLFAGPESRTLKTPAAARQLGTVDAGNAARLANQEDFPTGTIIFLDIEEGGRLPTAYHEYLRSWSEVLAQAGYRPGVYCSAIPVASSDGATITTAQDIQDHAPSQKIVYWVYGLACPPSPGCSFSSNVPAPAQSGFAPAAVWQYAQSPRRMEFTRQCPANYSSDGNCYAPGDTAHQWFLDANVAISPDPSSTK